MSQLPPRDANPQGLHQRYVVTKADGDPVDPMATYFVLRLDGFARDWHHIQACRAAARVYADNISANPDAQHLHRVADEMRALLFNLETMGG